VVSSYTHRCLRGRWAVHIEELLAVLPRRALVLCDRLPIATRLRAAAVPPVQPRPCSSHRTATAMAMAAGAALRKLSADSIISAAGAVRDGHVQGREAGLHMAAVGVWRHYRAPQGPASPRHKGGVGRGRELGAVLLGSCCSGKQVMHSYRGRTGRACGRRRPPVLVCRIPSQQYRSRLRSAADQTQTKGPSQFCWVHRNGNGRDRPCALLPVPTK
jgi:hypothetical protein